MNRGKIQNQRKDFNNAETWLQGEVAGHKLVRAPSHLICEFTNDPFGIYTKYRTRRVTFHGKCSEHGSVVVSNGDLGHVRE